VHRQPSRVRFGILSAALAVGLLAAGCGSGGSPDAQGSPSASASPSRSVSASPSASASSTTPPKDREAAMRRVQQCLKHHANPDRTDFRHYRSKPSGPKGDGFTTSVNYGEGRAEALIAAGADPLDSYLTAVATQMHATPRLTARGDAITTVGPLTGAEKAAVRTCVRLAPRYNMTNIYRALPKSVSNPPPGSYYGFVACLLDKGAVLQAVRPLKGTHAPGFVTILPGGEYAYLWKSKNASTAARIKAAAERRGYAHDIMVSKNNKLVFAGQDKKLNDKDLPIVIGCGGPQHPHG
jgi:hypothetical protein